MSGLDRRVRAGAAVVVVALLAALVAWLVRPRDDADPSAPRRGASPATNVDETTAKPHAPRAREAETPPTTDTETPQDAPATPKPGEPAAPTYLLEVTVLRGDGAPAPGASVLLVNLDDDGNPTAGGQADASGVATFRVQEDVVRVVAWLGAESMATAELVSTKDQGRVTVRLGPSMVVHGRVLRGDATPEPNARVELTSGPWFKSEFELQLVAKSGAEGRFEFPPIPLAGIDPLNPPCVEATTADKARGFANADPERPDAEVVVHLTPGFTVRARFVDADGKPIAAELLADGARNFHEQAGSDGRVSLRLMDAKYEFVVRWATGEFVPADFDVELATPSMIADPVTAVPWHAARSLGVHEAGAGDVDLGDVVVAAGKPVRGRVVDAAERPEAGASVALFLGGVRVGETVADKEGRFDLPEVGDQPHRIHVRSHGDPDSDVARHGDLDDVRGGDVDVRVVLKEQLVIAFRFLSDADRKPLTCAHFAVRAKLHGEGTGWFGSDVAGGADESSALEVPAPGSYDVEVDVAGYEPVKVESVEVVAGRPSSLDVLLRKKHE